MKMNGKHFAVAACLVLLGCGGETADTDPPVIKFFEGSSGSAFFSSDGASSAGQCSGGVAASYAAFRGGPDRVHARSGDARARITVTFSDPSGIKRAYLQIPRGQLSSPAVTNTVPVATAGGVSEAFEYNFVGDASGPQSTHSVLIDLQHGDANRVFNVFAVDLNDNRTETVSLLIGERSRICG